jgi:ribosome recycling factor
MHQSTRVVGLLLALAMIFSSTVSAFLVLQNPSSLSLSSIVEGRFSTPTKAPSHGAYSSSSHSTSALFMSTNVKDTTSDAVDRMAKTVDSVIQNLGSIRTGRASPAMLDRVQAVYYGTPTPINQMATISSPSSQQLTIDPFDKKTLGDIERAIIDSDLGLTPQNDGSIIRLNIPSLTEDRRKEMMKQCKGIGEEGKVAIRNIRRSAVDAIKKFEKSGDISIDESKDGQDSIQKTTDAKVKEIDVIVAKKEKEVMTV